MLSIPALICYGQSLDYLGNALSPVCAISSPNENMPSARVGNPMYRMLEKSIAEDCRNSEKYREKLFEKIDFLVGELRPDKELLREREARAKQGYLAKGGKHEEKQN